MLNTTRKILAVLILAATSPGVVVAQDAVSNALTEQGKFWQSRGDYDKSADAWSKLLRLEPKNADALLGMGLAELNKGRIDSARNYLAQLKTSSASRSQIAQLERALDAGRADSGSSLESARALARSRQYDEAVKLYKEYFAGQRPTGLVALEYYQTLGATRTGWDEARRELESLSKASPNDDRYALAYAQHLSYREASRRQSIQILSALTGSQSVGQQALQAWRQALIWLESRPSDSGLYTAYLERNPNDANVQKKLDDMRNSIAPPVVRDVGAEREAIAGRLVTSGFQAVENNNLALAERDFQQLLSIEPNNRDALGGLGIIRLRQERFKDAEGFLGRAARGDRSGRWNEALSSARIGNLMVQANTQVNQGRLGEAKKTFGEIRKLPGGTEQADTGLAKLAYEEQDFQTAERLYRGLLQKNPNNTDARVGLVLTLSASGRADEAQRLIDSMPESAVAGAGGLDTLRAAIAYESAKRELRQGNESAARQYFEDTVAFNPSYPWARVELARLYNAQGRVDEANALIEPLTTADNVPEESLYAAAVYFSEVGNNTAAAAVLARIPKDELTKEQRALTQRTEFRSVLDQASTLNRLGRKEDARRLLSSLEQEATQQPDLLLQLASEYAEGGDTANSMRLMQQYRSTRSLSELSSAESIQYGYVLLKNNQTAELQSLIRRLQNSALSADQSRSLAELTRAIALKQSDALRNNGDLAGAYDAISPSLAQSPNDPDLLAALARLYSSDNKHDEALRLYQSALSGKPSDVDLLGSALGAAAAAQEFRIGRDLASSLERARPTDPIALAEIGRFYRASGDTGRAQSYFEAALAAEVKLTGTSSAINPDQSQIKPAIRGAGFASDQIRQGRIPGNPFRQGSPSQALSGQPVTPPSVPSISPRPSSQPSLPAVSPVPVFTSPGDYVPPPPVTSGPNDRISVLQNELRTLVKPKTSLGTGGIFVRSKQGESGLSQLTEVAVPVQYQRSILGGTGTVSVTPVVLSSGDVSNDFSTTSRFGAGPAASLNNLGLGQSGIGSQEYAGAQLGAAYASDVLRFDVATRPSNIDKTDASIGLSFSVPVGPDFTATFQASRRPVTDSILSYVGAKDDRAGLEWGAVSATGGRVGLTREVDGFGLYGYLGLYQYDGQNVADNEKTEFGMGTYYKAINEEDERLTVGLGLNTFGFSDNLSYFTFGHGGYFSPQRYVSITVPMEYWVKKSKLSYGLSGSFGFQTFKEDGNVYFPTSALLQAQAQSAFDQIGLLGLSAGVLGPNYGGRSENGFAYNLAGTVEYALSQKVVLGGLIGLDNASDFQQFKVGMYLRVYLDQEETGVAAPPQVPNPFMY
ncbi:cellulose biosynthesis protein BcsC [Limnobacter parvus]|uniref:Cellulose synthase subunit BcsC-related outer membrane protein n=1 Tax=Limnobacter parvus TaxID=2939690 RepID=A0ABT1XKQ8_9BURK|nr:cellulose biosynthesis protein BcsC [Limnobacter parvus]MCR2747882.1 cellulose synthase subunit BcsC-related outer membrane protein [Limnobacter parvus]